MDEERNSAAVLVVIVRPCSYPVVTAYLEFDDPTEFSKESGGTAELTSYSDKHNVGNEHHFLSRAIPKMAKNKCTYKTRWKSRTVIRQNYVSNGFQSNWQCS